MNVQGLAASFLYIFAVIFAARFLTAWGQEISRKFIHIMVAHWWLIAIAFFTSVWWAALVPLCFTAVNWLSCKKSLFPGMEREEASYGTVFYALALLVLTLLCFGVWKRPEIGLAGALSLGWGDGLAALLGRRFPWGAYTVKTPVFQNGRLIWKTARRTLTGSLTVFLASLTAVLLTAWGWPSFRITLGGAAVLALSAAAAEALGGSLDNLLVPLMPVLLYGLLFL